MLAHEQLALPDGVEVDTGIANLLAALWELGLQTSYSCQGTPAESAEEAQSGSDAYIQFPGATDAWAFFSQTLEAISTPNQMAKIVVDVRYLARPTPPGTNRLKHGPALTLELGVDPSRSERGLRGVVRLDPELMSLVEAAFADDGACTR